MEYVLWLLLKEEKGERGFGGSHGGSEMVEDECDDNECCLFHGFGLAMILFMKPFYICFPLFSKAEHERLQRMGFSWSEEVHEKRRGYVEKLVRWCIVVEEEDL